MLDLRSVHSFSGKCQNISELALCARVLAAHDGVAIPCLRTFSFDITAIRHLRMVCHIRKRMQEKLLRVQLSEHPELRAGDSGIYRILIQIAARTNQIVFRVLKIPIIAQAVHRVCRAMKPIRLTICLFRYIQAHL